MNHRIGLQDLLGTDDWCPTSLFPKPPLLGRLPSEGRPQQYINWINRMAESGRLDLKFLRNELNRANGTRDAVRGRAAVLEFWQTGLKPTEFQDPSHLEKYLAHHPTTPKGRLYILEEIATEYVEAFGTHFSIDPSFFAKHLRTTFWEKNRTASTTSSLPSTRSRECGFSLLYEEAYILNNPAVQDASSLYCDSNLYRRFHTTGDGTFYDEVATVTRRISFWPRTQNDETWDGKLVLSLNSTNVAFTNIYICLALILVDPPVGKSVYFIDGTETATPLNVSNQEHYKGGYIDFMTFQDLPTLSENSHDGPPRTSIFNDIIYYSTQFSSNGISGDNPLAATYFARKIVAATWMNFIEYIKTSVSVLEYAMETRHKLTIRGTLKNRYDGLGWLEEQLPNVYGWKRKCSQYCNLANENLDELGISLSDVNCLSSLGQKESQDWIYIKKSLELWESRAQGVVGSTLGLLSLVESNKSVEEAKSTRTLAILGTIYLPLSLMAGILSMSGEFIPGGARFWVYFVLALPLLFITLLVSFSPQTIMNTFHLLLSGEAKKEESIRRRRATFEVA
jgi:hypothetical protein